MRQLLAILAIFTLFGCGTDFYLNKQPIKQVITLAQGDRSLQLTSDALVMDNIIRARLESDIFHGWAKIIYENGDYHVNFRSLPVTQEQMQELKKDLYAAFFAGDYPFRSTEKMFGKTTIRSGQKTVEDVDGYKLYSVTYNGSEIVLNNLLKEYTIIIVSEKILG